MSKDEFKLACGLLGWTYIEMAKNLGVTPESVSRWANGVNRVPKTVTLLLRRLLEEHDIIDEFNSICNKKFKIIEHQLVSNQ